MHADLRSRDEQALFNPKTSKKFQKHHPHTGNLNRETSGDSENAFLLCGDVLAEHTTNVGLQDQASGDEATTKP